MKIFVLIFYLVSSRNPKSEIQIRKVPHSHFRKQIPLPSALCALRFAIGYALCPHHPQSRNSDFDSPEFVESRIHFPYIITHLFLTPDTRSLKPYCFHPSVFCPLPSVLCLLSSAFCPLSSTFFRLPTSNMVLIIRRTRPFRGHHTGSHRVHGRTHLAKQFALRRGLFTDQNLTAGAAGWNFGIRDLDVKLL